MSAISELQAQRDAILFTHKWVNHDPVEYAETGSAACLVYASPKVADTELLSEAAQEALFTTLIKERPIELIVAAVTRSVPRHEVAKDAVVSVWHWSALLSHWNDHIATELAVLDLLDNTIRRLKGQGDV